jgi:integrase/recombinase XerD
VKSLSKDELKALLAVAQGLDRLMFTVMFNHGLRVSEVINLDESNVVDGHLVVQRLKGSEKTCQPLLPDEQELTAMRGRFFPLSRWTVNRRVQEYGERAGIPAFKCHSHSLKHSCAKIALAGGIPLNELQRYLGHKSLASTGAYLASDDQSASAAFAAAMGR